MVIIATVHVKLVFPVVDIHIEKHIIITIIIMVVVVATMVVAIIVLFTSLMVTQTHVSRSVGDMRNPRHGGSAVVPHALLIFFSVVVTFIVLSGV